MLRYLIDTPKRRRLFWFLVFVPSLLIGLAYSYVLIANSLATPGAISRQISPISAWVDNPVEAALVFNPGGKPVEPPRLDVVFCIDYSGSMGSVDNPDSNLSKALGAARNFAHLVSGTNTRMALMFFDHQPLIVSPLSSDFESFIKGMKPVGGGGGTSIARAVAEALNELTSNPSPDKTSRYIIVISDGQDEHIDPLVKIAANAEAENIKLVGVGIGYTVIERFWETIFTAPHFSYCCYPDVNHLYQLFLKMIDNLGFLNSVGRGGTVREFYNNRAFDYLPEDKNLFYLVTADSDKGLLEWGLPILYAKESTVRYNVIPKKIGIHHLVSQQGTVSFKNPSGREQIMRSNLNPILLIVSPWLLFWLYLPALLYFLCCCIGRRAEVRIKNLADISVGSLPTASFNPAPPVKKPVIHPAPTIIVGIGGCGLNVMCHMKHTLKELMPWDASDQFLFLGLDTDRETQPPEFCDARLAVDERFFFPDIYDLRNAINEIHTAPQNFPYYSHWLDHDTLARLDAEQQTLRQGTQGNRQMGRLALLKDLESPEPVWLKIDKRIGEWIGDKKDVQLIMVGSTTGGTSSGSFIDAAHLIKKCLTARGIGPSVPHYAFLSRTGLAGESGRNHAAFIEELCRHQYSRGHAAPMVNADGNGGLKYEDTDMPLFDRIFLFGDKDHPASVADVLFLFCEESQKSELLNLLSDPSYRILKQKDNNHDCVWHAASISSVRFPVGMMIEETTLRILRAVLEQHIAFDCSEGRFFAKKTLTAKQVIDTWKERNYYTILCDPAEGRKLASYHTLVFEDIQPSVLQNTELPDTGQAKKFYQAVIELWLNGAEPDENLLLSQQIQQRMGRFGSLMELFRDITAFEAKPDNAVDGQEYIELHQKILSNLMVWNHVLVEREGELSASFDRRDGLYRFLHTRHSRLEKHKEQLQKIPCRLYVWENSGNPDYRFDTLWEKRIKPVLEDNESPFAARCRWQIADNLDIRFRFSGQEDNVFLPDQSTPKKIYDAFFSFITESLFPDISTISLFDKLTSDLEIEKNLTRTELQGDYVLLTFPKEGDDKAIDQLKSQIQKRIQAPKIVKEAKINNPLIISLLSIQPDQTTGGISGAEATADRADLDFNFPAEQQTVHLMQRREKRTGHKTEFFSPALRSLARSPFGYETMVRAIGMQYFRKKRDGLFTYWALFYNGQVYLLNRAGSDGRYRALSALLLKRRDSNGNQLDPSMINKEWQALDRQRKIEILEYAEEEVENFDTSELPSIENELSQLLVEIIYLEKEKLESK